jgi:hypothetical protein
MPGIRLRTVCYRERPRFIRSFVIQTCVSFGMRITFVVTGLLAGMYPLITTTVVVGVSI